jgi:ParB-like chromosome segregation protein Spo0J
MQTKNEAFRVEWWAIDRVVPYAGNPRRITDAAVIKVAASIEAFDWRQPIVVDEQGVILVGHTRRLAAIHLGREVVPVHVARGLTPAQARGYRLADNRLSQETQWDPAALADELAALELMAFDIIGFDPAELPSFEPNFGAMSAGDVKPLDQRAAIICPECGHSFQP